MEGLTRAQANASPQTVVLGKKYELRVSPLRDEDWSELEQWVQAKYIRDRREQCKRMELTEEETERQIDRAFDKAATITLNTIEATRMLNSLEGCIYFSWLHLRREQPQIDLKQVAQMLTDPDVLIEMMQEVETADRLVSPPEKRKKKSRTRKATSKRKRSAKKK